MNENYLQELVWLGSSKKAVQDFPDTVRKEVGFALFEAQQGKKHIDAKPLKGFGGASVLEIVERYDGDTYRAVYTVKFAEIIYILHAFQKKSTKGIQTAKQDIELVKRRLKQAEQDYQRQSQ